jgi:hypothetical protein
MNPRAFGLSTYAVVDSPELEQQSPSPASEPEKPAAATTSPAEQPKKTPAAPPMEVSQSYQDKRVSRKTQIVPDLDELESL